MFHPLMFWLSGLFGGGQWTRAIHPWIGIVLLISYAGLVVQFWRDNLWNREDLAWTLAFDRVLANEEEDVPEVARFNAGQKFVFWSMALLIPALIFHRHCYLGRLFHVLHFGRAAALCCTDPFPGGDCRDPRLDHPCLCWDLGQGFDARDDSGLCDTGVGVAASSQMVPGVGGDGIDRATAG